MQIKDSNRYLKIPVRNDAERTSIDFCSDGKLIFDLFAEIDFEHPDFYAYYDMKNLMSLDVEIRNRYGEEFECVDHIPEEKTEQPRPRMHFSPKRGWMNDPNGLIYYEGKYHMFFQYNPVGIRWANMHWGHAVSENLVHWEEKEIALYPDEHGYMYSGCAIEDVENVTGLKENEHNPLLLFYTTAGDCSALSAGKPYTQCLAYSIDGGETFVKYGKNPIIGNLIDDNRDPTRVLYDEENRKYIMTFWLHNHEYVFFRSDNLLEWEELSRIQVPCEFECPDLYELYENGVKKCVLAPAFGRYMIGTLDAINGFVPETGVRKINFGATQAPQRFAGIDRMIRISWNKCIYDGLLKTYNSVMGTPCEMYLKDHILRIRPVEEFLKMFQEEKEWSCSRLDGFSVSSKAAPSLISFRLEGEQEVEICIFGNTLRIVEERMESYYLFEKCTVVSPYVKGAEITIITDDVGIEVFVGDQYYLVMQAICDYRKPVIEFHGTGRLDYLKLRSFVNGRGRGNE